ncbi:uncharacterized protein [Penaeus vannamei]|uniref:uncharacterized protein isoform X1 n=1 Tax=Penaeus vannamei TaxID=6689 RepID=UPI00387F38E2
MISRNHQGHPRQDKDQRSCFPGTEEAGTEAHISPYAVGIRQSGPSRRPRCGSSPSSFSWLSPSPSSAPSPWPAVGAEVTMGVMEEEEVMVAEASVEASEAVEDWEVEEALAAVSEDKT